MNTSSTSNTGLMRGERFKNQLPEKGNLNQHRAITDPEGSRGFEPGLDTPLTVEKRKLYERADLQRTRIIYLSFGLVGGLIIVGVISLVALSLAGTPSADTLEFLKLFVTPLVATLTFIVGYHFRAAGTRGGTATGD